VLNLRKKGELNFIKKQNIFFLNIFVFLCLGKKIFKEIIIYILYIKMNNNFENNDFSDFENNDFNDFENNEECYLIECNLIEAFTFLDFGEDGLSQIIKCINEINKIFNNIKQSQILELKELIRIIEKMDSIAIKNEDFEEFLTNLKKKIDLRLIK